MPSLPPVHACPACPRRPLAPADVLRAARGEPVPGLPPDLARALGRCRPGPLGWRDLDEARARGWLLLVPAPHRADLGDVATVWGWWCAAARQPEAVVRVADRGVRADVTLDLSPAGLVFAPAALTQIGQACLAWGATGYRWIVTPDSCQVDGLAPESARGLVGDLLVLARDRRCVAREPDRWTG